MMADNEDSVVCDLAETYGILDWTALPVGLLATLCDGLGQDSRTARAQSGLKMSLTEMLLARLLDVSQMLLWIQTEDGRLGVNRPASVFDTLTKTAEGAEDDKPMAFESGEDFWAAWNARVASKQRG